MIELTKALYTALSSDAVLTGLLARYAGLPAVFTFQPTIEDTKLPYIITSGNVAEVDGGVKSGDYTVVTRDIRCYADNNRSAVTIETIADRVRVLLDRQPSALNIVGYTCFILSVVNVIAIDDDDAMGRVVTIEAHIKRN